MFRISGVFSIIIIILLGIRPSLKAQFIVPNGIVFSEINYNAVSGADSLEFFELYNRSAVTYDLSRCKLGYSDSGNWTAPIYTWRIPPINLAPGGRIIFARDSGAVARNYGYIGAVSYWDNVNNRSRLSKMADEGGKLWLLNHNDNTIIDTVHYESKFPWPTGVNGAAGEGASISLCDASADGGRGENWTATTRRNFGFIGGKWLQASPGEGCGRRILSAIPISSYVIEVTFDTVYNTLSATDFANYQGLNVSINSILVQSGNRVQVLLNDTLPDGTADTLRIAGVLTASGTVFDPYVVRILWNRHPYGPQITEILYNIPGQDSIEFIELYNPRAQSLPLGGLTISGTIRYTFPEYFLPPDSFILVAADTHRVRKFFNLPADKLFEWDSGNLSDKEGIIKITNTRKIVLDSVNYNSRFPWPSFANGQGASVRVCNFELGNDDPCNWTADTLSSFLRRLDSTGAKIYGNPLKKDTCARPVVSLGAPLQTGEDSVNLYFDLIPATRSYQQVLWSTGDTGSVLKVIWPGQYSVSVYDSIYGCISSAPVLVQLNNLPTTVIKARFRNLATAVPEGFWQSFEVVALNRFNGIVSSYNDSITIYAIERPSIGRVDGITKVKAVNGIGTFAQVRFTAVGRYKLVAELPTALTTIRDTITIDVFAPSPTPVRLRFDTISSPVIQNMDIPRFRVLALTNTNELATLYNSPVTLEAIGVPRGTLDGNLTRRAINGEAAFDLLQFVSTGNFRIRAFGPGVIGDTSEIIVVEPGPVALEFGPMVCNVGQNRTMTPFIVRVLNAFGNLMTDFNGVISIRKIAGPTGGVLAGSLSKAARGGIATFDDIQFSEPGDYQLAAQSGRLNIANSCIISVFGTTDREEFTASKTNTHSLIIYPNPSSGVFEIAELPSGVISLGIFDATGRLIKKVLPINNQLDLSDCVSGCYYIKVETVHGFEGGYKLLLIR